MPISFSLHVGITPTVSGLLLGYQSLLLLVQLHIDPPQQECNEELYSQQDHDCGLGGDVGGSVLWLEYLSPDDVSDAERHEGQCVESTLLRMSAGVARVVCINHSEGAPERLC